MISYLSLQFKIWYKVRWSLLQLKIPSKWSQMAVYCTNLFGIINCLLEWGYDLYIFNCNQRNHPELLWQAYCFWQFLGFVVGWSIGNFHFCMTICIKPTVLFLCKQVGIRKYFLLQGISRYLMVN